MKAILDQLARSGLLLDDEMEAAIFAGNPPPMEEIVLPLIFTCADAEATVRNDSTSTWNEKRIARAFLAIAFLSAIACSKKQAP
jgi:hypothetical protein